MLPIARRPQRGELSSFVNRHSVLWETVMAVIAVAYVLLAIWDDDFNGRAPTAALLILAVILFTEFAFRFWDSADRWHYLRRHWIDLVACIPVIGGLRPLRLLRIVRLVAGLRLMAAIDAILPADGRGGVASGF